MSQKCRDCDGTSFSVDCGIKICNQCGTEQQGYVELRSEGFLNEVDRSCFIRTREDDEVHNGAHKVSEEQLNSWTTYDAFNVVLHEWTKALCGLGASPLFKETVFKLWVTYLHRIEIAFMPRIYGCRGHIEPKMSIIPNKRDVHLIHRRQRSVSPSTLSVRSFKRKKKIPKEVSKLEKLKDKLDHERLKREMKSGKHSTTMSGKVSLELSRSLTELDLSCIDGNSANQEESDKQSVMSSTFMHSKAGKDGSSFIDDDMSYGQSLNCSESESESLAKEPRRVSRNGFVKRWIEKQTNIYDICPSEMEEDVSSNKELKEESRADSTISYSLWDSQFSHRSRTGSCKREAQRKKVQRKVLRISVNQKRWLRYKKPFHLNFRKLLGLLYLAVLLAKEEFLLMDIIRWCREGHIPYMSAQYLLKPDMKLLYYDMYMLFDTQKIPTAKELQDIAGNLAIFLSIQSVPLPPIEDVISRLVKVLHLPESVGLCAQEVVEFVEEIPQKNNVCIPPIESLAMASIIVVLKAYCGINDNDEIRLSHAANMINADLQPSGITAPLFSWDEWMRYIGCMVWFCTQVDPVSAQHCQWFDQLVTMESSQFSKFFWSEAIWRHPKTNVRQNKILSSITRKLLDYQDESLENVLSQPSLFKASLQPFMSIVEEFLLQHRGDKRHDIQKLVKIADELVRKSFTFHSLEWTCRLDSVWRDLQKCDSNICVLPEKVKKQKENTRKRGSFKTLKTPFFNVSSLSVNDVRKPKGKENSQKKTLIIPQPLKRVWKLGDIKKAKWKTVVRSFPASFRWLMNLGSLVCETEENQIYSCVCKLEKNTRKLWY